MVKCFESTDSNVFKYVFTEEDYVAEAVLYRYGSFYDRTVICCSTQSGCPVGCVFCGTGNKFIRNLTASEIVNQIHVVLKDKDIERVNSSGRRFQIMFMSMGEPFLNYAEVELAIRTLHKEYPNAELLLSTIATNKHAAFSDFAKLSCEITKIGLQFSIHRAFDEQRNELIPFKDKMTLKEIRDYGIFWYEKTGRKPYLNYCIDGTNNSIEDAERLMLLFSPVAFNFTFSVVCSADETMKDAGFRNIEEIQKFEQTFIANGYDTRIFDPAGQDDIGGGCGQLWYVQDWMREHGK